MPTASAVQHEDQDSPVIPSLDEVVDLTSVPGPAAVPTLPTAADMAGRARMVGSLSRLPLSVEEGVDLSILLKVIRARDCSKPEDFDEPWDHGLLLQQLGSGLEEDSSTTLS